MVPTNGAAYLVEAAGDQAAREYHHHHLLRPKANHQRCQVADPLAAEYHPSHLREHESSSRRMKSDSNIPEALSSTLFSSASLSISPGRRALGYFSFADGGTMKHWLTTFCIRHTRRRYTIWIHYGVVINAALGMAR